jgi:hypothetical protein
VRSISASEAHLFAHGNLSGPTEAEKKKSSVVWIKKQNAAVNKPS